MAGGVAAEQISVARLHAAQPHGAETELSPAVPPAWGRDASITGPQAQATWKCTASVTCPNCGENSPPDATLLATGSRAQLLPSSTSRMEPIPSGGRKHGFPLPSGGPPQEFCNVPQLCPGEGGEPIRLEMLSPGEWLSGSSQQSGPCQDQTIRRLPYRARGWAKNLDMKILHRALGLVTC